MMNGKKLDITFHCCNIFCCNTAKKVNTFLKVKKVPPDLQCFTHTQYLTM